MTADLPRFGPTKTFPGDEDSTPLAAVTLSVTVTREQLRAALGIGHMELAGEPPLADLTVKETRREVEGYLAAAAILGSDAELRAAAASFGDELTAELDAAIDRAYTRPNHPKIPQTPHYRDGTVTLQTLDHGEVTIPEPAWCTGHDDELVGYLAEVTHRGRETKAGAVTEAAGYVELLDAQISHAPYLAIQPEPHPVLSIHLSLETRATPGDVRAIAYALRVASLRLDHLDREVQHLRNGGQA
ncbi:hypothetical protein [Streptomyces sp. NPDC005732]|uniref:DUF6907 domain-containing protein n=1 Tax=Streptomyces sp. NPDC005732 TaxID=3157057 RepID=UPI0033CFB424